MGGSLSPEKITVSKRIQSQNRTAWGLNLQKHCNFSISRGGEKWQVQTQVGAILVQSGCEEVRSDLSSGGLWKPKQHEVILPMSGNTIKILDTCFGNGQQSTPLMPTPPSLAT